MQWQELIWRLSDVYQDQMFEYRFEETNHLLLLCPQARDLLIDVSHTEQEQGISVHLCRRETTTGWSKAQQETITNFVLSLCHWIWRDLAHASFYHV